MRHLIAFLLVGSFTPMLGCGGPPPQPAAPKQKLTASKLTALVVDDPGIAAGLKLLRGEWLERSDGELVIEECTTQQLLAAETLTADLVIYPSRYLGTLVERDWVRTVRSSVLESDDVATQDMFPLVRDQVLRYGNRVYALTLGEPPLMLQFVSGETDATKLSWSEVPNPNSANDSQFQYPLAIAFLARSVAYAQSRSGVTTCLDPDTMEPRLAAPPFVKSLSEMLAIEQNDERPQSNAMFGWPHADAGDSGVFVALPIADEVFRPLRGSWEDNDLDRPITVFPLVGRSVSVTRATRNSASASKLMRWLVSDSIAGQLSPRSSATLWFRKSQERKATQWLPANGAEVTAASVTALLSSGDAFLLPRIPGIDEYLGSLEESIQAAAEQDQSAANVLGQVAQQWNEITDRLGRDRQRAAYRRHLGLGESAD